MGMTFAYGQADEAECLKVLDRSIALGMHFWDTAQVYGPFTNESLLGRALKGRRDQIVVATKFAWREGRMGAENLDGSPDNARKSLEGSLQRLGTDYVDLLYLHRLDPKTPIEETFGAMAQLVREGKVRYLGLSEVGPNTLRRANAIHPVTALQSEYSLWEIGLEPTILPVLRELGIGLVPFSPVGRGFLTGALKSHADLAPTDMRRNLPRFQPGAFEENTKLVEAVRNLAAKRGATAPQVALAWLLRKGADVVPIPGTTHIHHLEENAKAAYLRLEDSDWAEIEAILKRIQIVGDRYNEGMARMVSKD
jgi:aryl-alcohol dehydrogenase-like predicted oxidoreductase